jgi:hypothetical protein
MHGVRETFVESVEVDERFQGKRVWQGAVKVFGSVLICQAIDARRHVPISRDASIITVDGWETTATGKAKELVGPRPLVAAL